MFSLSDLRSHPRRTPRHVPPTDVRHELGQLPDGERREERLEGLHGAVAEVFEGQPGGRGIRR